MKDEIKNRISMALKDPILQQGFEIICKENAELKNAVENNLNQLKEQVNENERLRKEIGRLQVLISDEVHKNSQLRQIILGNEEEMSGMKDNLNEAQRLLSDWVSDKPSTVSEHKDLISDTENLLKELYL